MAASSSTGRIRLVTRGDDIGSSVPANIAIVECLSRGVLRNTSVMVPGPAFHLAVPMLKGLKHCCIGLHVTLNSEWETVRWGPVLPPEKVPSLLDDTGHFTRSPQVLESRRPDLDQMQAEVQAQLDAARASGIGIHYMDEHMMVGRISGLRERLARLAEREGLVYVDLPGLSSPGRAETDRVSDLAAALAAAPPGSYLMVTHPYAIQHARHADMPAGEQQQREQDRQFWLDSRLPATLRDNDTVPVRYIDL